MTKKVILDDPNHWILSVRTILFRLNFTNFCRTFFIIVRNPIGYYLTAWLVAWDFFVFTSSWCFVSKMFSKFWKWILRFGTLNSSPSSLNSNLWVHRIRHYWIMINIYFTDFLFNENIDALACFPERFSSRNLTSLPNALSFLKR